MFFGSVCVNLLFLNWLYITLVGGRTSYSQRSHSVAEDHSPLTDKSLQLINTFDFAYCIHLPQIPQDSFFYQSSSQTWLYLQGTSSELWMNWIYIALFQAYSLSKALCTRHIPPLALRMMHTFIHQLADQWDIWGNVFCPKATLTK